MLQCRKGVKGCSKVCGHMVLHSVVDLVCCAVGGSCGGHSGSPAGLCFRLYSRPGCPQHRLPLDSRLLRDHIWYSDFYHSVSIMVGAHCVLLYSRVQPLQDYDKSWRVPVGKQEALPAIRTRTVQSTRRGRSLPSIRTWAVQPTSRGRS